MGPIYIREDYRELPDVGAVDEDLSDGAGRLDFAWQPLGGSVEEIERDVLREALEALRGEV